MAPALRLRLPPSTARLRLTVLYAGMLLLIGAAVIAALLLIAKSGSTVRVAQAVPSPAGAAAGAHSSVVQQKSADVNRLLTVSWLVLVITAIAAAVIGWFASGRTLRPLRQMAATARTISAGNLHQRRALRGPDDEIKQLGDTLDELLARLEASFEAQRRFVANASHELRTPLTIERTLLQVALADPNASAATLRAACEELLASGRQHERLLEALLALASSERGLERHERLDLAGLAGRALDRAGCEIERRGLRVDASLDPAPSEGDPALLERLIANLVDNAVHHNHDRGRVEIRTGEDAAGSLISVGNTGTVVPAREVDRLFQPFERLVDSRAAAEDGHFGLGLSIIGAVAAAHGAALTAEPRSGGGLEVTVRFDRA